MANFLNQMVSAMGDRLNAKFNPSSPTFAQGGLLQGHGSAPVEELAASAGPVGMGAAATVAPGGDVARASPERERIARNMGFRDYDTMIAFERNRQVRGGGNPTSGVAGVVRNAPANAMVAHPKNIFEYITAALRGNPQGQ